MQHITRNIEKKFRFSALNRSLHSTWKNNLSSTLQLHDTVLYYATLPSMSQNNLILSKRN